MYMHMDLWRNVLIMNDCPFYLKTTCITMLVFSIRKTLLLKTNIQLKMYSTTFIHPHCYNTKYNILMKFERRLNLPKKLFAYLSSSMCKKYCFRPFLSERLCPLSVH